SLQPIAFGPAGGVVFASVPCPAVPCPAVPCPAVPCPPVGCPPAAAACPAAGSFAASCFAGVSSPIASDINKQTSRSPSSPVDGFIDGPFALQAHARPTFARARELGWSNKRSTPSR